MKYILLESYLYSSRSKGKKRMMIMMMMMMMKMTSTSAIMMTMMTTASMMERYGAGRERRKGKKYEKENDLDDRDKQLLVQLRAMPGRFP